MHLSMRKNPVMTTESGSSPALEASVFALTPGERIDKSKATMLEELHQGIFDHSTQAQKILERVRGWGIEIEIPLLPEITKLFGSTARMYWERSGYYQELNRTLADLHADLQEIEEVIPRAQHDRIREIQMRIASRQQTFSALRKGEKDCIPTDEIPSGGMRLSSAQNKIITDFSQRIAQQMHKNVVEGRKDHQH